jgi:small subunit ribosomal protein S2e
MGYFLILLIYHIYLDLSLVFSAKATYAAIAQTYAYLTPDLWKETILTKSPYQEFTDYLAKNHKRAEFQRQEQKVY